MAKHPRPTFRAILEAVGAKCTECKTKEKLTINHKKPLSLGGSNDASNLEILCETCHRKFHGIDRSKSSLR